ncbi:conserved glutamic acid-rich protein [Emericellopsis cladophorae]|uniref:Conserved glutamic acid-rich protein n=1 Tax=Emericellopsis cladophorae TaxID=2686198 RepID=A0A9P9XXC0_9HYPO|nr:conserved glutamic acid-rich protein [Emericellopsis cladophorae]KAI6779563.1 conserved glutamic acid-rich protein [Emericellopsis cladophorae]
MTDREMDVDTRTSTAVFDDDLIDYDDEDFIDQAGTKEETLHSILKGVDNSTLSEQPTVGTVDTTDLDGTSKDQTPLDMALKAETTSNTAHEDVIFENEVDEPTVQEYVEIEDAQHADDLGEYLEDIPEQPAEQAANEDQIEQQYEVDDGDQQHDESMEGMRYGEEQDQQTEQVDEPVTEADANEEATVRAPVEELQDPEDLESPMTNGNDDTEDTTYVEEFVDHPAEEENPKEHEHLEGTWDGDQEGEGKEQNIAPDTRDEAFSEAPFAADGEDRVEASWANAEQAADSSQEKHDAAEANCQIVTVQYKGEEFPLFSRDAEGFFPEETCLALTIDQLLAGLRVELENELADEEELVFQIDELGLEYAESSKPEHCNVTLSYILEVFNLLVKNQGQDDSRTLYTYLFTKTTVRNEDAESIELYEQLDDLESPGDEAQEHDGVIQPNSAKEQTTPLQPEAHEDDEADKFHDEAPAHPNHDLVDDKINDAVHDPEEEFIFQQEGEEQNDGSQSNEARDAETGEEQFVEEQTPQPTMGDTNATTETDLYGKSAAVNDHDVESATYNGLADAATLEDIASPRHMLDDEDEAPNATFDVEVQPEVPEVPTLTDETDDATWDPEFAQQDAEHVVSPNTKRPRDDDEEDIDYEQGFYPRPKRRSDH